jgi:hypothetical protein
MINISFKIDVSVTEDNKSGTVVINCDTHPIPFIVLMVMTEHLMTMTALESNHKDGFEGALKSLCDGARTNKVQKYGGVRPQ